MTARFERIVKGLKVRSIFFLLVSLFLLVVCWERVAIIVGPGQGGVIWKLVFGGTRTTEGFLGEGLHLIFPWDRVFQYDLRMQKNISSYDVVTKDALQVKIELTFRYRPIAARIGLLHKAFGPQYIDTLLSPVVATSLRHVFSRYTVDDLVSERRNIQSEIMEEIIKGNNSVLGVPKIQNSDAIAAIATPPPHYHPNVVEIEDILIAHIELPKSVREAIESKLQQAQLVEEYGFRVQREALESRRKEAEAAGIRNFQAIVSPGLTDSYLRWRGIEATLELARSPNSKVVVIGNQQSGGLPLILDGADRSGALQPLPGPTAPAKRP